MHIIGIILTVGIVIFFVMPMWAIVACDFWRSVIFKDCEVKLPYPWPMTLLGPAIISAICVGIAYLVKFDVWMALGLCLFCVVNGMVSGLVDTTTTKKDRECDIRVFAAYFAVIVLFIFATTKALSLASW